MIKRKYEHFGVNLLQRTFNKRNYVYPSSQKFIKKIKQKRTRTNHHLRLIQKEKNPFKCIFLKNKPKDSNKRFSLFPYTLMMMNLPQYIDKLNMKCSKFTQYEPLNGSTYTIRSSSTSLQRLRYNELMSSNKYSTGKEQK